MVFYRTIFTVRGITIEFPLDMLRLDRCTACTPGDSSIIFDSINDRISNVVREVDLVHFDDRPGWEPSRERWCAAGWNVEAKASIDHAQITPMDTNPHACGPVVGYLMAAGDQCAFVITPEHIPPEQREDRAVARFKQHFRRGPDRVWADWESGRHAVITADLTDD